jgi:hypothetical protein
VSIGTQGKDTLLLMVTHSRCVILDPNDAKEHPLAIPNSDEFGPDLTFIEIFPGPKLDLLKAIVSFWNLDQKHYELANKLSAPGIVIVEAGFPEIDYRTRIIGSDIHHDLKFVVFIGALEARIFPTKTSGTILNQAANTEFLKKYRQLLKE